MNSTINLLRAIGSPFCNNVSRELPKTREDARILFEYAQRNKIGLLFLETLNEHGLIDRFDLTWAMEKEVREIRAQRKTALRVAEIFNNHKLDYAIFKSIMPFSAKPNDVDIIFFDSDERYRDVPEYLRENNYVEIGGVPSPSEIMFHDASECQHLDISKKDIYDVDVYREIGASHIIYLDKKKLRKYRIEKEIDGTNVKILENEAELIATIVHSMIPEMLLTLSSYYVVLNYISRSDFDSAKFLDIAKYNEVISTVSTCLSVVAALHKEAHGSIPEKLESILLLIGGHQNDANVLRSNDFKMPHRYTLYAVLRTIMGKCKEQKFRASFGRQLIGMLNPRLMKWVVSNMIWRRQRDSY